MTQRFNFAVGIVLVVVTTLVCVIYLQRSEGLPRSQTLADGSVLTVEAVLFGNSNACHEPFPSTWQLAVGKWLPYTLAASLGWRFNTRGNWRSIGNPIGMKSLVLFTKREGPGMGGSDPIRVIALDDDGNSLGWDEGPSASTIRDANGTHYHQFQSWDIPAFPRRGKTLLLRFLRKQGAGEADLPIMQCRVANPRPGPYPVWTPEPWPATVRAGDLTVTLTDFTTGLSQSEPTRAAVQNEAVETRLALEMEEKGRTNCPWQVTLVEVSDATGNRWTEFRSGTKTKVRPRGVTQTMYLPGNLWAGEAAWNLRVELAPKPNVPPDQVVTLSAIPVPADDSTLPLSLSTNIDGFSFALRKIEAKKPFANVKRLTLSYDLKGMPNDCHLSLLKVTDEEGRKLQISAITPRELSRALDSFDLAVPSNAGRLNATFALRKSRFAQFLAKPRTLSIKPAAPATRVPPN